MCWACASPASGGGALHYRHGPPTISNPLCTCQWILDHTIRNWPSWVPQPKCHNCEELLQEKLRALPPPPPPQQEREFFIGPKTLGETLVTQEVWRRLRKLATGIWLTETTLKDWEEWHLRPEQEEEWTVGGTTEEVISWGFVRPRDITP